MKRIICCTLFLVSLMAFSQSLVRSDFMDQLPRTCDDLQNYQFNYPLENGMDVKSVCYLDNSQFLSLDLACIFPMEYNGNVKSIQYQVYARNSFLSIYGNAFYNTNHELIFFESKGTHSEEYMYGFDRWSEIRGHKIRLIPCIPNSFTFEASPTRNAKGLITNIESELVYSYDSQGRVIKVVLRNGEEGTYQYEYMGNSKNIRKISVYMYGRIRGEVIYGYENGHIVRVDCNMYHFTGPEGNIETEYHKNYKYDNHNNISEIVFTRKTCTANERTMYTFDNTYDTEGKLTQSQIRIRETGKFYPHNENLTRKYSYDVHGNWIKIEDDKGSIVRQIEYWSFGDGEDRIYTDKEVSVNATFGNSFTNLYKTNGMDCKSLNGTFIVEKDGSISVEQTQIQGDSPKTINMKDVIDIKKVFEELNWIPATINGKPVRSYVDVAFKYQKNKAIVMKDIKYTRAEYDAYNNGGKDKAQFEKTKREAEDGYGVAKEKLIDMYLNGIGTQKDINKALDLMVELALKGAVDDQYKLLTHKTKLLSASNKNVLCAKLVKTYDAEHSKMDANQDWAAFICELAATSGNVHAIYEMGQRKMEGKGVLKDIESAIKYFEQVANKGNQEAMLVLGEIYLNSLLGHFDEPKAIEWLTKAYESGNRVAKEKLGYFYINGIHVKKNKKLGKKILAE